MSLREKIKAAASAREVVEIPGWGIAIEVRPMSAAEALSLLDVAQDELAFRKLLLRKSIVDEDGELVYDETSIDELMQKDNPSVRLIIDAARRVNGFIKDDVKKD